VGGKKLDTRVEQPVLTIFLSWIGAVAGAVWGSTVNYVDDVYQETAKSYVDLVEDTRDFFTRGYAFIREK